MLRYLTKKILPRPVVERIGENRFRQALPEEARKVEAEDLKGLPEHDPGPEEAIRLGLNWLCRAQDFSTTADGGVASYYSLVDGWSPSYPETTGYIVPTVLREARLAGDRELEQRARRMLDWLVSIQFPEGSFQGGLVTSEPKVAVAFNTGQILLGLAAGAVGFAADAYLEAMHKAANWLVTAQHEDGCWRGHPSPFTSPGEKAYETHVSWGLFEAERVAPDKGYGDAGLRQVRWALTRQEPNGWFRDCCVTEPDRPLTHTLGYVLRGILEAYRLGGDTEFLEAAKTTAAALKRRLADDGHLAGRFDSRWRPAVDWSCLTGNVQIAWCWFQLYEIFGDSEFLQAGRRANGFVRRSLCLDGDPNMVGGVKGSFPVSGGYERFSCLNWAAKFLIDANRYELELSGRGSENAQTPR